MPDEINNQLLAVVASFRDATSMEATMRVAHQQAEKERAAIEEQLKLGFAVLEDCEADRVHPVITQCEASPAQIHMVLLDGNTYPPTADEEVLSDDRRFNCYYCNKHYEEIRFRPATIEQAEAMMAMMEDTARNQQR